MGAVIRVYEKPTCTTWDKAVLARPVERVLEIL